MKKASTTKRALLMSVLATLMCCAMLVGSTFAWFTDSVTSGTNKIVAGNLDVELEYWDETLETPDWVNVSGTTGIFEGILWEPGMVVTRNFRVTNAGSLALKYQVSLKADANEVNGHSLKEVITVGYLTEKANDRDTAAAAANGSFEKFSYSGNGTLEAKATEEFTLVLAWNPTNHDNDYNMNNENQGTELYINVGVNLLATQAVSESDSYGPEYDKYAMLNMTEAINQGAKDSNAAIIEGIKEIAEANGTDVPENIAELVYFDDELAWNNDGELAITLHFEEGSKDYVEVTYTAVKALIAKAVNDQASNIKSITIATAETRVLDGNPFADASGDWVEQDLKTVMKNLENRTLAGALEAAQQYGLPVVITDMSGNSQTYRMNFDINW